MELTLPTNSERRIALYLKVYIVTIYCRYNHVDSAKPFVVNSPFIPTSIFLRLTRYIFKRMQLLVPTFTGIEILKCNMNQKVGLNSGKNVTTCHAEIPFKENSKR